MEAALREAKKQNKQQHKNLYFSLRKKKIEIQQHHAIYLAGRLSLGAQTLLANGYRI
jgi:hypothetical protein